MTSALVDLGGGRKASVGESGMPDLLVELPDGAVAWCEVKRPGQHPRPNQHAWHAKARERGQVVLVVTSADEAVQLVGAVAAEREWLPEDPELRAAFVKARDAWRQRAR